MCDFRCVVFRRFGEKKCNSMIRTNQPLNLVQKLEDVKHQNFEQAMGRYCCCRNPAVLEQGMPFQFECPDHAI